MTRAEKDVIKYMRAGGYACWSPINTKIAFVCHNTMEGYIFKVRRRTLGHLEKLGLMTAIGKSHGTTWILTERGARL
jgi:hypothetical protein